MLKSSDDDYSSDEDSEDYSTSEENEE